MADKRRMIIDRLHIIKKAAHEIGLLIPCDDAACSDCPVGTGAIDCSMIDEMLLSIELIHIPEV
jgi:hypothetical protein